MVQEGEGGGQLAICLVELAKEGRSVYSEGAKYISLLSGECLPRVQ